MAETVVSNVAQHLIGIIKEHTENDIYLGRRLEKEVLNLAMELVGLIDVLDDAEHRRSQDKSVNYWLSRLEQISYDMEDVLDEWNYAIHKDKIYGVAPPKHKVCPPFIPSPCLCFKMVSVRHNIAKKIKDLKEQLDQILLEKDRYGFVTSMPTTDRSTVSSTDRSTVSFIDLAKVQGRDRDVDILVSKLIDDGDSKYKSSIPVLSIVGMGGLGKTTLAQMVYNHSQVEKFYDLRIWICVTDTFDLAAIAQDILRSIRKESPNTMNLEILLELVSKSISGRRFLLVLDDIWTENRSKWESLKDILMSCGALGSKILVTTRNERVVRIMGSRDSDICRPGLLSDEDCWLLLCRMALSGGNEMEFEKIGKEIAKKCNGLPLVAKTLGSLLRFKSSLDEWKNVLNSEIWKMDEAEVDIFPHLFLSYNELSPTLKHCFSYCAIFPLDTKIDVEKLIENWMALGYLGSNIGDMELKGRGCFDVLAMRSLFQDFETDGLDEKIRSFKMHDLVHDFVQYIRRSGRVEVARMNKKTCQTCDPFLVQNANQFCSLFWDEEEYPPSFCDCLTCLRVLSMNGRGFQRIPQGMENLIHLRKLDLSGNIISQANLKTIFQLYFMQTLRLYNCNLEEIPREIENLIHLRHLDLSYNESLKELPESICGLHELRTLVISYCESLSRIPEGLAELTSLYRLSEFRGGSGCSKLEILNKLKHLRGDLRLIIRLCDGDLEGVIEDAREARLRNQIRIRILYIEFEDEMVETEECDKVRMDVVDALEPYPNLQRLGIRGYKGSKLPSSWIVSPVNQLRSILLGECTHLSSLPPLGILPCLEEIECTGLKGLEFVGREFLGIGGGDWNLIAFPKLKKLTFRGCPELKEWEDITAEQEQHFTTMPRLTQLIIEDCPEMTKLPRHLLSKALPLEKLDIIHSEKLQQHCRDIDGLFL